MAVIIKPKHSGTAGWAPPAASLQDNELAVNTADRRLYTRHAGTVVDLTGIQGDGTIMKAVRLTQAAYDALGTPDPLTLYIIVD